MQNVQEIERVHPVFLQFGFREKSESGSQSIGNCPLCGTEGHFFINRKSKNSTWDCKKCLRSGGYKSFVDAIVKDSQKAFTQKTATVLCQSRGLLFETLKRVGVGFHALSGQYIVPSFNEQSVLVSCKVFGEDSFRVVAGQTLSMYTPSQENSLTESKIVYLCEGEWDTLMMVEVITALKIKDSYALGVPGAGFTLKPDFLPALKNKSVILLYDNDAAGKSGRDKSINLVISITPDIKIIDWPGDTEEGFDIRDLYIYHNKRAKITFSNINDLLTPAKIERQEVVVSTGKPPDCKLIYEVFRKWLHLPSTEILDVIFGTALSAKLPGDPLWMFIVAPPGGTKTEPLLSLTGPLIETVSTLTVAALISGSRMSDGRDPSLIPKLNNRLLVIKDFTSILGINPMERDEIFTILRDAYDGECRRILGNGVDRSYKSRFSVLAASTPVIESFTEDHAGLGERFLRWRHELPKEMSKRIPYIKKALGNVTKEKLMRAELCEVAEKVLMADYGEVPEITQEISDKVISLSQITGLLRATIHRNKYSREVEHNSFYELATRISKELYKLLYGITMFRGKKIVTDQEYSVAVHVARSSVTRRIYDAVQIIYESGKVIVPELSEKICLPSVTCRTILENLFMIHVAKKEKEEGNNVYYWSLTDDIKIQIEQSNFCRKNIKH
jgi:hypothetical protein